MENIQKDPMRSYRAEARPVGITLVQRVTGDALVCVTGALFIAFALWMVGQIPDVTTAGLFIENLVKPVYWTLRSSLAFWLSPFFLLVVPSLLLLTAVFPADRAQPIFSRGFFQDVLWSVARTSLTVLLLTAYASFIQTIFQKYFGWMVIETGRDWPFLLRAALVFIVADFLYWLRHVVMHKVPALWQFHAIHHSQRELNPFTINRTHPVGYLVTLNIWAIPMTALMGSLDVVLTGYLIRHSYDAFIHSNIRTNLGPLKYFLVTPQSHRVHHSCEPQHYDTNFGVMISLWDRLFGTLHSKYDEYPETGIPDPSFPVEQQHSNHCATLIQQLIYPFQKVFRTSSIN